MPLYEVQHICLLTASQKDQLAEAFTTIHAERFAVPRLFVNVTFADVTSQDAYVAGIRRISTRLIATIRRGPQRTHAEINALADEILAAWASIVGTEGDKELRGVFILDSVAGGAEAGFPLPKAGEERKFFTEHYRAMELKAKQGDQDFVGVMKEMAERPVFKGIAETAT